MPLLDRRARSQRHEMARDGGKGVLNPGEARGDGGVASSVWTLDMASGVLCTAALGKLEGMVATVVLVLVSVESMSVVDMLLRSAVSSSVHVSAYE